MMMITLKYEVQLKPSPTICTAIYPKLTYYSITKLPTIQRGCLYRPCMRPFAGLLIISRMGGEYCCSIVYSWQARHAVSHRIVGLHVVVYAPRVV